MQLNMLSEEFCNKNWDMFVDRAFSMRRWDDIDRTEISRPLKARIAIAMHRAKERLYRIVEIEKEIRHNTPATVRKEREASTSESLI